MFLTCNLAALLRRLIEEGSRLCVPVPGAHPSAAYAEVVVKGSLLVTAAIDAVVSIVSSQSGSSFLVEWGQEEHGCDVPLLVDVPVPAKVSQRFSVGFFFLFFFALSLTFLCPAFFSPSCLNLCVHRSNYYLSLDRFLNNFLV